MSVVLPVICDSKYFKVIMVNEESSDAIKQYYN